MARMPEGSFEVRMAMTSGIDSVGIPSIRTASSSISISQMQKIGKQERASVYTTLRSEDATEQLPAALREVKLYLEQLFGVVFDVREYRREAYATRSEVTVLQNQQQQLIIDGVMETADGEQLSFQLVVERQSVTALTVQFRPRQLVTAFASPVRIAVNATAATIQAFRVTLETTLPVDQFFIPFVDIDSHRIALDRNGDGRIDPRSELSLPPTLAAFSNLNNIDSRKETESLRSYTRRVIYPQLVDRQV